MPFYQLHLMFLGAVVVLVGGPHCCRAGVSSLAAAVALINPKTLPLPDLRGGC